MESRSTAFLEIMVGIAAVGIVAFLIYLFARYAHRPRPGAAAERKPSDAPAAYEFVLAMILVLVVVAAVVWQLAPVPGQPPTPADWRADTRSLVFFGVMLVIGGLGLLAFLIFLFARTLGETRAPVVERPTASAEQAGAGPAAGAGIMGLVLLGLAFLVLNWAYVPRQQQFAMMAHLIYPASLGVALVLLLDKATRSWNVKNTGETVREWLLCDAIVFLLILGFLNLSQSAVGAEYAGLFLDFLYIVLFFITFLILDRMITRYRFLVAYGYLIAVPMLLLIWRAAQAADAPPELSWWSTIWPFFSLAIIFFVLEVITLVATKEVEKQVVPIIKDAVFLVLYGVLLVIAIPEAAP